MTEQTTGGHDAHGDRPGHLHHHFETEQQQFDSDKLGMWLFLVTEILLFGGLFCAYAYYRTMHPEIFIYAHKYLDKTLGGINTVVLITSSLTMAWAVRAAQLRQKRILILMLSLTLIGAFGFLGIKAIEYNHKWKHGLLWGKHFQPEHAEEAGEHSADAEEHQAATPEPAGDLGHTDAEVPDSHAGEELADEVVAEVLPPVIPEGAPPTYIPRDADGDLYIERSKQPPAATGPAGLAFVPTETGHAPFTEKPENVHVFFGIYFAMTGLHGLHVIAGIIVIITMLVLTLRGRFDDGYFTPIDLTGLYWHLVDLIWIFLFPLLYLIH